MYRKAHKGLVIKATESFNLETIVIDQYYCTIPSGIDNFELAFLVRHTYITSVDYFLYWFSPLMYFICQTG